MAGIRTEGKTTTMHDRPIVRFPTLQRFQRCSKCKIVYTSIAPRCWYSQGFRLGTSVSYTGEIIRRSIPLPRVVRAAICSQVDSVHILISLIGRNDLAEVPRFTNCLQGQAITRTCFGSSQESLQLHILTACAIRGNLWRACRTQV